MFYSTLISIIGTFIQFLFPFLLYFPFATVCYVEEAAMACRNESLYYYNKTCVDVTEYCGLAKFSVFNETHCLNSTGDPNIADGVLEKITASEDYFK